MKKAKKSIGIVLIAILLILCLAVDALGVRYSTVVTRFWSGTYGTVQTETDDTQLKATDAAAELTETIAEEGIVLMKNNGLLPMAPSKENRNIALLGYASYSPMYIGAGSVSQAGSYVSNEFIDFYSAFETAGYTVNKDMKAYYAQYGNSNGATGDMSGSGWSQATGVDDGPLYGDSEASVAYTDVYHDSKGLFFQDPTGSIPFQRTESAEALVDAVDLDPAYLENLTRLEREYHSFTEKGIPIYVAFACVDIDRVPQEQRGNTALMDRLYRLRFSAMDGVTVVGSLGDYLYRDEDCYDTVYHLLTPGAERYGQALQRHLPGPDAEHHPARLPPYLLQ